MNDMPHELPNLPFEMNALEPHISEKTLSFHYGKHHAAYCKKFNDAVSGTEYEEKELSELLVGLNDLSGESVPAIRNNGGGAWNHSFFWECLCSENESGEPSGELLDAITASFGSFEEFKAIFSKAAGTRFGSGWAWLCVHPGGELEVCSTANQDNPLMEGVGCGGYPILGLDVWEHAYYLNYQNRRPDYIAGFFNVINWEAVSKSFLEKS